MRKTHLQVFKDGKWKWVFCYRDWTVYTTPSRQKALPVHSKEFFEKRFPGYEFRGYGSDETKGDQEK